MGTANFVYLGNQLVSLYDVTEAEFAASPTAKDSMSWRFLYCPLPLTFFNLICYSSEH